ncbi:tektin-2 [Alosa pseudoharengus]|uniref:tektin-2 n=1 Tax=Alosa pseudoharengus TaxID=34774 RepID=UPI003F8AC420
MATLSAKPGLRHNVSDWEARNKQLSQTAEYQRQVSHDVRQEGLVLRNETTTKTKWDESDSSRRLADRIQDINHWKSKLEHCAQDVDKEMDALTQSKEETELALAATALPLEVTIECLALWEGRRGGELVSDPVEAELKKDVELIDNCQRTLQQRIDQSFEQLCLLQEAWHEVNSDLQNKRDALDVDMSCLSLTVTSPQISLKPKPLRIPASTSTPQQWEKFSIYNIAKAKEEMQASLALRENMSVTRAQVQNDMGAQEMALEFALRKRKHHLLQSRDELKWQLRTTQDEIQDLEKDIRGLETDLHAKQSFLKLTHTRLENRFKRPGVDLCWDEVQFGLVEELKQLEVTVQTLHQKLGQARHSLQALQQHEACMQEDLSRKDEAVALMQRCQEVRKRIAAAKPDHRSSGTVVPLTNSSGRHAVTKA